MSRDPLVTVIMNCYNGEQYLRTAIDSVLAQTYANWEIVFWDNQSTDRSAEMFKSYADSRMKYFVAPQHTLLYEARNHAIAQARGELLAFLDVDDWWLPGKLEKQTALFDDESVGFACANYWIENEQKGKRWQFLKGRIPTGWVLDDLLASHFIGLPTLMIRRAALDSLEYPCDPRYHVLGDYDLEVRLAVRWKLAAVQEPIAFYRLHANNETAKQRDRHVQEMECWLQEMGQIERVRSSRSFSIAGEELIYLKAINNLLKGDKREAYRLSRGLPWGRFKLRLWIGLVAPPSLVRRLKNN